MRKGFLLLFKRSPFKIISALYQHEQDLCHRDQSHTSEVTKPPQQFLMIMCRAPDDIREGIIIWIQPRKDQQGERVALSRSPKIGFLCDCFWISVTIHRCVGHTTWAPKGREGRSQAGPKLARRAATLKLDPGGAFRLLFLYIFCVSSKVTVAVVKNMNLSWGSASGWLMQIWKVKFVFTWIVEPRKGKIVS